MATNRYDALPTYCDANGVSDETVNALKEEIRLKDILIWHIVSQCGGEVSLRQDHITRVPPHTLKLAHIYNEKDKSFKLVAWRKGMEKYNPKYDELVIKELRERLTCASITG